MRTYVADIILLVHFCLACFIVLGLGLIWLGAGLGWQWTHNFWFRLIHLSAIVCVAMESIVGIVCPLTRWEDALRQSTGTQPSFVARWIQRLLFYVLPEWVFTAVYIAAAVVTALTWLLAPPRRSQR